MADSSGDSRPPQYILRKLFEAASKGNLTAIKGILLTFPSALNTPAKDMMPFSEGDLVIHAAAERGHMDIVDYLVSKGASINAHNAANGDTPLISAMQPEYVRELIKRGADVNLRRNDGSTALFRAANTGFSQKARTLLELGADPDIPDETGRTPLLGALHGCAGETPMILVNEFNAKVNVIDCNGKTPLMLARERMSWDGGMHPLEKVLLEKGAQELDQLMGEGVWMKGKTMRPLKFKRGPQN